MNNQPNRSRPQAQRTPQMRQGSNQQRPQQKKEQCEKKKFEFSKWIVLANILIVYPVVMLLSFKVVNLAELAIMEKFSGALPYLTAIITPAWAAFATILAFYFNKSKAENKEKIKKNSIHIDC